LKGEEGGGQRYERCSDGARLKVELGGGNVRSLPKNGLEKRRKTLEFKVRKDDRS